MLYWKQSVLNITIPVIMGNQKFTSMTMKISSVFFLVVFGSSLHRSYPQNRANPVSFPRTWSFCFSLTHFSALGPRSLLLRLSSVQNRPLFSPFPCPPLRAFFLLSYPFLFLSFFTIPYLLSLSIDSPTLLFSPSYAISLTLFTLSTSTVPDPPRPQPIAGARLASLLSLRIPATSSRLSSTRGHCPAHATPRSSSLELTLALPTRSLPTENRLESHTSTRRLDMRLE